MISHQLLVDYHYKFLSSEEKVQINVLARPRLRKDFVLKWYFYVSLVFGKKTILRHKRYRYRIDNMGFRYILIYVPIYSVQDLISTLILQGWPFRVKNIHNRYFLRLFIEKYQISISFDESTLSKIALTQITRFYFDGLSSPYIQKHE
jgi:hypothetical protein